MSLGINSLWRFRPQRLGLISILRESYPRRLSFYSSTRLKPTASNQGVSWSESATANTKPDQTTSNSNGYHVQDKDETLEALEALETEGLEADTTDAALHDFDQSLTRNSFDTSVLVEPVYMFPNKKETRESLREHHKSVSRQVKLEETRVHTARPPSDWRLVLQKLIDLTPEETTEWHGDAVKMVVSNGAMHRMLYGGGDETIGSIRKRTGAFVKISRHGASPGTSSLLLSGSRDSINKAADEIRRVAERATVIRLVPGPQLGIEDTEEADVSILAESGEEYVVPRLTREEGAAAYKHIIHCHVSQIPKPKIWSTLSFQKYIESLVDAQVAPHLYISLYNPDRIPDHLSHERTVIRLLHIVFNDEATRPHLSCNAFKLALRFMSKKGHSYRPDARALFVRMEQYALRMDTDVFNYLLMSSVKARDLRSFDIIMRLMAGRGHVPNRYTWLLFLRLFESREVKWHILKEMNNKGMLRSSRSVVQVAEGMVAFDADSAVTQGKDLPTFLAEQQLRYGPDWLTSRTVNYVLKVFASHGRFEDCGKLMDHMAHYAASLPAEPRRRRVDAHPNINSFNTVITQGKVAGKISIVTAMLCKMTQPAFRSIMSIKPDTITYQLLFEMAWHLRMPTALAVVWRFASMARLTSWQMRRRVSQLLSGEGLSASAARKLITPSTCDSFAGGAEVLEQLRISTDGRHLGTAAAHLFAETYKDYRPASPSSLGVLFRAAVERDYRAFRAKNQGHMRTRVQPRSMQIRLRLRNYRVLELAAERASKSDEAARSAETRQEDGDDISSGAETKVALSGNKFLEMKLMSLMDAGHREEETSGETDGIESEKPGGRSEDHLKRSTQNELLATLATMGRMPLAQESQERGDRESADNSIEEADEKSEERLEEDLEKFMENPEELIEDRVGVDPEEPAEEDDEEASEKAEENW